MQSATIALAGSLLILLAVAAGIIILQIHLSKKESKWAGLILPIISFGLSIIAVFGILAFSVATTGMQTVTVDGVVVEQTVDRIMIGGTYSIVLSAVYIFLLCNIPTAVLGAIYAAYSGKRSQKRALGKMSVQDLG